MTVEQLNWIEEFLKKINLRDNKFKIHVKVINSIREKLRRT